jgi:hypothetical protein
MLKIQGPVHFDNVDKKGHLIKNPKGWSNPNTKGIYVWGFMYKYENEEFIEPIDFSDKEVLDSYYSNKCELPSNWKFLPYYVGKKESNIFSRIKQHQDVRNVKSLGSDADKYIRFSHKYMPEFLKDPMFPIKIGNPSRAMALINLIHTHPNSITYHNEKKVLQAIFPNLSIISLGTSHPITLQKINGVCIPDTLEDLVVMKNNFWFCYLPIKEDINLIKKYESYIFWSLKGKTISVTESFSKIDKTILIQDITGTDIFIVDHNTNNLVATNSFSGY